MPETRYFIPSGSKNSYCEGTVQSAKHQEQVALDASDTQKGELAGAVDPFIGRAPVSKESLTRHLRGEAGDVESFISNKLKRRRDQEEKLYQQAADQAARHDIFLLEDPGFITTDDGEKTYTINQSAIRSHVDIASASKQFELNLDEFGPYRINYTSNGKHLLLGGRKGHVAAFEWFSKKLLCELNVMESINDVRWLHTENMFAVAQNKWTYVYDSCGVELHCLKSLHKVLRLDYLPYHFLVVASTATGYLHYLDISVGKIISSIRTKSNRLNVLTQNPNNAVMCLGHHNGTVTMWSPNSKEPLVKMLCHKTAVRAVAIDKGGLYMATSGQDGTIKIFDIRTYHPVHSYKVMHSPSNLKFSHRGLLAASCSNIVEIYKDPCREVQKEPYLVHRLRNPAEAIEFCSYEDILGVGREDGFESLLVPGAGEPNYDGLESDPYRSKTQRKEWEVKALLEKIQPDMISLDPFEISSVDALTANSLGESKAERSGIKADRPKFEPKFKLKGRSSAGSLKRRKEAVRNSETRKKIKADLEMKRKALSENTDGKAACSIGEEGSKSALDRFKNR